MSNLGLYIKEALKDKNEIYLPEIGTFKKERMPAFFDDLKNCFMPPVQSFILTEEQVADQFLIEFIAKQDKISLEESRIKAGKLIKALKNHVEVNEEAILEGLGKLKKENNGYTFYSTLPSTLEAEFREYEPIAETDILEPISIEDFEEEVEVEVEKTPSAPIVNNNSLEDIEQETSSKRWLWPVFGIAICVLIAGIWFLNPVSTNSTSKVEEVLTKNQLEKQTVKGPAQESDEINAQNPIQEIQEPIVEEPTEGIIRESTGKYEIIIAAFNTMEEAKDYVAKTNAKGYNVYILRNNKPSNLNKISYASFQHDQEANEALAKVRKELTPDAWVFENKKTKINN